MTLTTEDLNALEKCFITPELAEQARLFRVDSPRGAHLVGRNGRGDYSGIAIPNVWPGEDSPREYRLRRDRPDLEEKADGTPFDRGCSCQCLEHTSASQRGRPRP